MKNLKIISYQRNGVQGNGFYVATANEFGKDFVITFETGVPEGMELDDNFADRHIKVETCRAICLSDLTEKWRGDDFALEMQKIINRRFFKALAPIVGKTSIKDIYDLLEKAKVTA